MIGKTIDKIAATATPRKWPLWLRRMFVVLFPVTIPLLALFWVLFIMCCAAILAIGIVGCFAVEFQTSMRDLWDRH